MEKKTYCPLCKKQMDVPTVNVCQSAYAWIINQIKKDHPDWVKENGACPKCIEYYKNLPE